MMAVCGWLNYIIVGIYNERSGSAGKNSESNLQL